MTDGLLVIMKSPTFLPAQPIIKSSLLVPWLYSPPPWPNVRSPNDEKYNGCSDKLTAFIPVTEWCNVQPSSTQMKEMAKAFHHEMSPRDPNPVKEHTEFRSNFRIKFIERTVKAAE